MKKEKYRVRLSRVFQGFRDSLSSLKMGLLRPTKFENQCSVDLEMSDPNCVQSQSLGNTIDITLSVILISALL